ncbi:HDOD domain-containing protein [Pseudoalteromonas sp. BZB3]|uniref:HDOD domain-containing protein n=1 Tax=Pseudoalteromonas sp. BZB3 TaxID=3136670 RepID=UPI0032C423AD
MTNALAKQIDNIPMLPSVISQLLSLSVDDPDYFNKVIKLAESDPTFAIRIIKLSNTVPFGIRSPIISIHDAVIRVGIDQIHNLLASIAVTLVFVPVTDAEKRLWQHSLEVACLARLIASHLKECHVKPEQAYLAGLLHDLGLFLRFQESQNKFNHIDDYVWSTPAQFVESEKQLFDEPHAVLSEQICRHWKIPKCISNIVAHHHHYELSAHHELNEEEMHLVRIIQLSDLCSEMVYHIKGVTKKTVIQEVKHIMPLAEWARAHLNSIKALDDGKVALEYAHKIYKEILHLCV